MTTIDEKYAPLGATVLRVSLGMMWIAHALLKWFVFSIEGFTGWLDSQGLPGFMAWPVFSLELVGGTMILLGIYGRYASMLLLPIMLVAAWTHAANGWLFTSEGGGWEYPVFLLLASLAHTLIGDGRLAIGRRHSSIAIKFQPDKASPG